MFQNLVLLLVLIGQLGPTLFVEGQEFGGCVDVAVNACVWIKMYRDCGSLVAH